MPKIIKLSKKPKIKKNKIKNMFFRCWFCGQLIPPSEQSYKVYRFYFRDTHFEYCCSDCYKNKGAKLLA